MRTATRSCRRPDMRTANCSTSLTHRTRTRRSKSSNAPNAPECPGMPHLAQSLARQHFPGAAAPKRYNLLQLLNSHPVRAGVKRTQTNTRPSLPDILAATIDVELRPGPVDADGVIFIGLTLGPSRPQVRQDRVTRRRL